MDPKTSISRGAVFLLVLVVTVGAFGLGPSMTQQQGTDTTPSGVEDVAVQTFQPETILADRADDSGSISMAADATETTVLIDVAHRNDITEEELGPIVRTLSKNGAEVDFVTREDARGDGFNASLRQADAFIAISPQEPYTQSQVAGLTAFEDAGGRILMLQEPNEMSSGLIVLLGSSQTQQPAPMAPLATEFGLSFGNGYLYNMQENDNNYRSIFASPSEGTNLSDGVERVSIRAGTTVTGGSPILATSASTTLSTTRDTNSYTVAARSGNVTAVGDTSLFTETGYQNSDNEVFVGNLLDFLVSGEKVPGEPAKPKPPTQGGAGGSGARPTPSGQTAP